MKTTLMTVALAVCAVGVSACAGDRGGTLADPTADPAASIGTDSDAPGSSVEVAPEPVVAAGGEASIGFNNAAQVTTTDDGVQHYVFVTDSRVVMHGSATGSVAGMETTPVFSGQGKVSLTATAATEEVIVIGWTEAAPRGADGVYLSESADGGETWSEPRLVEAGASGVSLAADGDMVVASWFVGGEDGSEIHFASRDAGSGEWSAPVRVDESDAAPLWPAVEVAGDAVWVTWRDNRDGAYHIYLRRSLDAGATWLPEQELTHTNTGDPTVCAGYNGVVWLAYHGRGKITAVRSADGGEAFGTPVVVGSGWFARLSCEDDGDMILGWEQSDGVDPKADDTKQAVYVTATAEGAISGPEILSDAAGTCASVTVRGDGYADAVWVDKTTTASGAPALTGELWHAAVKLGT